MRTSAHENKKVEKTAVSSTTPWVKAAGTKSADRSRAAEVTRGAEAKKMDPSTWGH